METQELVSIIVPIFNTEQYLTECLDSLKKQSYSNLEIILVNDGSTDHSGDICREYCRTDPRFVLIEQANQGLGMSRNAGIVKARGKYVCFVDSDDFVHEKYVEILYENLIAYHTDISMCAYMKYRQGQLSGNDVYNVCSRISRYQMLYDITTTGPENSSEKIVVAWNKLIKMDIMKQLRFTDRLHEDEFMINDLLQKISNGVWTDAVLYYYRQRSESITGTEHKTDLRHLDVLDAVYNRICLFSGNEYKDVMRDLLRSYFENSIVVYYSLFTYGNRWQVWKKIYTHYLNTLLRYAYKLSLKQFFRYALFLISPYFYRKKYWRTS